MWDHRLLRRNLLNLPEDAASPATWATPQPDMSDCKSVPMTNLEVKVRRDYFKRKNILS